MKAMKLSLQIKGVTVMLAMLIVSAPGQGIGAQLDFVVVPEKPTVRLGEPIMVSVLVTNGTSQEARADRSATAFDCFEVTDPDGHILPYVGFDGQVVMNPVQVPAGSTATIADLDLTEKCVFQKAGRYSVRFTGVGTRLPVTIEVTPGQLSEFDQAVVRLLLVCPTGWHLSKDAHGEVTPFGRSRGEGFALHLCPNHMRAEAVYLWFARAEAKTDSKEAPRVQVDKLGRVFGLYVYVAVDKNTPPLWSTAVDDISRALQITKE
jgi:hypothetical protein